MADYSVVLLPGDGTGPEVINQARKILDLINEKTSIGFNYETIECGGKYFLETGKEWEEGSFERCKNADSILLGAIGWPGAIRKNGDLAGGEVVLGLRSGLDLYANVRPIKLFEGVQHKIHGKYRTVWDSKNVDMCILRENTEGLYYGALQRSRARSLGEDFFESPELDFPGLSGEIAWDPRPISENGSRRIVSKAFEIASKRNGAPNDKKKSVTCVDKSNVARGCQLFRRIFDEESKKYSNISTNYAYIDAFTMWLIRNPEEFDVVVTSNMFGDIATDLGSVLQGGMGMAASGNIGDSNALFEPVHGSSPKYAGKNMVNPIATINSLQMMLKWLGDTKNSKELVRISDIVHNAVSDQIKGRKVVTYDLGGNATTSEVGDDLVKRLKVLLD
ncbi:MAG: isocitrate/isopropylmalate dehydrogenase family protein [Methanobacteriota archaeon]|nr:MAG: isocitrate/isopropylmalate dehydrogenase family protein [Euryarchaeota archaeon]|tara:strand:- start:5785 stop:6957 length:1173 start_codon:yes stop_codon:yes gene_type:complete